MKRVWDWCKAEVVLCIAMILAIVSSFFVKPDKVYLEYIDFRTLAILFCLMAVMVGFQTIGLFQTIAERLLGRVHHIRAIIFVLISLCFFSSMVITNDVALITFVPFTFIVLDMVLGKDAKKMVAPVVVMQTIAANLGSMLTPIGNPQNLYLYGKADMGFGSFVLWMLPYTVISFALLTIWCMCFPYQGEKRFVFQIESKSKVARHKSITIIYGVLFLLCVLTVADVIPYIITLLVVVVIIGVLDYKVFLKVDYSLLLTFVGFFVFIGNMGRVPAFNALLQKVIEGNEILTAVVASQFMSNVPAALLLSGFTSRYELLVVGTNLGGLGTLIASMASLISFKYIGKEYKDLKGKYFWYFTGFNVLFLMILLLCTWIIFTKIL